MALPQHGPHMHATEQLLRNYIFAFHQTLEQTATQFLQTDLHAELLHLSLLPARIIGYVSTQFGTAIEYLPAEATTVEIVRGSARVEELFLRAPASVRSTGPAFGIAEGPGTYLSSGGFSHLTLEGVFPFRLLGPRANLRLDQMACRAGPWSREVHYAELFGTRDATFWSEAQAVERAKDEVLAALAQRGRSESRELTLAEYLALFRERVVLVLGSYDEPGLLRLRAIAAVLAKHGYDPILVSELPDSPVQDLAQKVATIGFLSRFVVVDDTSKSGHLMEIQLCKVNGWITALIRDKGIPASMMTAGASVLSNTILEHGYDSENPEPSVVEVIDWAEKKILELQRRFDTTFPWRMRP